MSHAPLAIRHLLPTISRWGMVSRHSGCLTPVGCILLVGILSGCAVAPTRREPRERLAARGVIPLVRVAVVKDADNISVSASDPWVVSDGRREADLDPGEEWRFSSTSGGLVVVNERGREVKDPETPIWVRSRGAPTATILVNAKPYRGRIEIRLGPGGKPMAINELEVEDYLRGVVPSEIGRIAEDEVEAGRALAVTARTYALYRVANPSGKGYDLEATEADQVYGGKNAETPLGDQVVRRTRGLVMEWRGQVIRANYHAVCGGVTASNEEVLNEEGREYLKPVKDRFCRDAPRYSFERRIGAEESAGGAQPEWDRTHRQVWRGTTRRPRRQDQGERSERSSDVLIGDHRSGRVPASQDECSVCPSRSPDRSLASQRFVYGQGREEREKREITVGQRQWERAWPGDVRVGGFGPG